MINQRQTQHERRARFAKSTRGWLLAVVFLAPLGMGARGCDQAVVGADCTDKANADNPACVCKYDGKYYAAGDTFKATDGCNHCSCQKSGEVACTQAACASDAGSGGDGAMCGGLTGATCKTGEYCNFAPSAQCGDADQTGTCAPKPQLCNTIYAPVCGCDDTTYGNDCDAATHGISVATKGECDGQDSGMPAGCDYGGKHYEQGDSFPATDGCNTCNCGAQGSVGCTKIGCTGGGKTCGGLTGAACAKNEFCNYPIAAICGAADATGTCESLPSACDLVYAPVCGCDDKTYGNACDANLHGVSVASEGECNGDGGTSVGCDVDGAHFAPGASFPSPDGCNQCTCDKDGNAVCTEIACQPGKTCGGFAGVQCDSNQYCDFPIATMCGSGDQSGTCKDRPDFCTDVIATVCGCDGTEYSNSCFASIAGTSVLNTGKCK